MQVVGSREARLVTMGSAPIIHTHSMMYLRYLQNTV